MPLSEFALIERYFRACGAERADVTLGVGDDAALLQVAPGCELVAATDTLVAGVHFPAGSPADSIGHRALAVNLSDLAAMGARPAWALLALTLPEADEAWLGAFARGLGELALTHGVALVGGDTTRGPLTITVQLLGSVPAGRALTRAGARAGDVLFVSGTCGDAAAGLAIEQRRLTGAAEARNWLRGRFLYPTPRVALGEQLRGLASACVDVSDGLLADAGRLAGASHVGAELAWSELPLSEPLVTLLGERRARELALSGGDDYELCFAVPPERLARLLAQLPPPQWRYTRIGALRAAPGAVVVRDGTVMEFSHSGYEHFR
ncbi:MAG: thiamine-phosphate kinase [Gammaproteobacteria bacterium]|nr:thiamine-phosphate kinase [Gammaproteobacteria bacterium]MBV8306488.1 thiamine-phosphate kinase [Gammaproteobacteria bacterium]MBV8404610.1 thiamine-phosphate kinase [Gammaproteobacteria bacterium]